MNGETVSAQTTSVAPAWWQVVTPHKDIRDKSFSKAVFAADLGSVLSNTAPFEYQDARTFIGKTYLTTGLKNLVRNILSRLSEGKGDPVIRLQTSFGGGKTHSLLLLYHLTKSLDQVSHMPQVSEILSDFPAFRGARVAAFTGTLVDPLRGRTPWGEIAYQLGCYEIVREHDQKRVAPGRERIVEILQRSGPTLVLIDELLEYVVKANRVEKLERITQGQTIAFLQELSEAVTSLDNCALVLTLPASALEQYDEEAERALAQLENVPGRQESIYVPVQGMEIYEIVRRRLFEDLGDPAVRRRVAEDYFNLYQNLGKEVPTEVRQTEYREKIERAYPFHPELIDVLYERWGSFPTFQRTRGLLRLLAEIVGDLYEKKTFAPLIQSSMVDLTNVSVRREFIKHIGNEYDSIVQADIIGKASAVDREMGSEYEKYAIARGLATATFLYSFSGAQRRGTTRPWLRVALLREGITPAIVGDALSKLEDALYYFHAEQGTYLFKNQPNLNRIIVDREEVAASDHRHIEATVRQELEKLVKGRVETYVWPRDSGDVPDNKKPKVVLLSPELHWDSIEAECFIKNVMEHAGSAFRIYRNTVFIVAPDRGTYVNLEKMIVRYLALKSIQDDATLNLSTNSRSELDAKIKDVQKQIPFQVLNTYRHVTWYCNGAFTWKDMSLFSGPQVISIVDRVLDYLRQEGRFLPKPTAKLILTRAMAETENEKSLGEIFSVFLKTSNLPCLESEEGLLEVVREGVVNGLLGVRVNDRLYFKQLPPELNLEVIVVRPEVAQREVKGSARSDSQPEGREPKRGSNNVIDNPEAGQGRESSKGGQPGTQKTRSIKFRARVPWDRLSHVISGVVGPLKKDAPDCVLDVVVEVQAYASQGFDRTTLDTKVKETLTQIGSHLEQWEEKV